MPLLQIGYRIQIRNMSDPCGVLTIDKVHEKTAWAGKIRFTRKYSMHYRNGEYQPRELCAHGKGWPYSFEIIIESPTGVVPIHTKNILDNL